MRVFWTLSSVQRRIQVYRTTSLARFREQKGRLFDVKPLRRLVVCPSFGFDKYVASEHTKMLIFSNMPCMKSVYKDKASVH